jgi:hypothetical protein
MRLSAALGSEAGDRADDGQKRLGVYAAGGLETIHQADTQVADSPIAGLAGLGLPGVGGHGYWNCCHRIGPLLDLSWVPKADETSGELRMTARSGHSRNDVARVDLTVGNCLSHASRQSSELPKI